MAILSAEKISYIYRGMNRYVFEKLTMNFFRGNLYGIYGANGCGKSTLLRCLNMGLRARDGHICINGHAGSEMKRRYIASKIAVVPQELPENIPFTAGQVVEFGRIPYQPPWGNTTSVDIKKTVSAMKRMNVFHLASRKFNTLSGGEKQRVLISKALAQDTEIILLDEPSSHLDISANIAAFKVLKELASAGKAVIAVCHDIVISPVFIDHAFLMGNSGIIAEGPPEKIFTEKNIEKTYGIKAGLEFSGKSKISLKLDL